jgi:hypothetical protein
MIRRHGAAPVQRGRWWCLALVACVFAVVPAATASAQLVTQPAQGKLFAATRDNKLWARDPVLTDANWQHIGHANDVTAMAATGAAQAAPSLEQLEDYKARVRPVLARPGITFVDADEACGCVTVGISQAGAAADVASVAAGAGVPATLVRTVHAGAIRPLAGLRDGIRPIKGGLQIQNEDRSLCTMTATVFNRGLARKGLLTNSHCTRTRNAVDGIEFFQAGGALFSSDFVAREVIDPPATTVGCPPERLCRRSDAAFARFDTSIVGIVGRLALPSATCGMTACGVTMPSSTSELRISQADLGAPVAGQIVHKIGRTTGRTRGAITQTCIDTSVADSNMVMLCQSQVAATSGQGDSGSPVFRALPDGTVALMGLLWGGPGDGTSYVFSSLRDVEAELGSFDYHE